VHVFFEHRELGLDTGDAGFLYPFLGNRSSRRTACWPKSPRPFGSKCKMPPPCGRKRPREQAIGATAQALWPSIQRGGKLILFGNGGSATDVTHGGG
jgi:D-sedoheptulose 7-phosphate isomerase